MQKGNVTEHNRLGLMLKRAEPLCAIEDGDFCEIYFPPGKIDQSQEVANFMKDTNGQYYHLIPSFHDEYCGVSALTFAKDDRFLEGLSEPFQILQKMGVEIHTKKGIFDPANGDSFINDTITKALIAREQQVTKE